MLRFLLALSALLIAGLFVTCHRGAKVKEEAKVQAHNVQVLTAELTLKTRSDGAKIATVGALELTVKQLQASKLADEKTIKALGIENKRLLAVGRVETRTITQIVTVIKDSLIYRDRRVIDTAKTISYTDGWTTLRGYMRGKEFRGSIHRISRLSLTEYITPKRFLFIRYGVRERNFAITSDNPRDSITKVSFAIVRK